MIPSPIEDIAGTLVEPQGIPRYSVPVLSIQGEYDGKIYSGKRALRSFP
jgi:hypothetical protein